MTEEEEEDEEILGIICWVFIGGDIMKYPRSSQLHRQILQFTFQGTMYCDRPIRLSLPTQCLHNVFRQPTFYRNLPEFFTDHSHEILFTWVSQKHQ